MTSKSHTAWPVPLRERDIDLGNAVRDYARCVDARGDEAIAYGRVLRRLAERPRRVPVLATGFAMGVVAAALVTMVALNRGGRAPSPERLTHVPALPTSVPARDIPSAPTAQPQAPARTTPASVRLAASPSFLPAGRVELVDEASAILSGDAVASGRKQAGHTEISLGRGRIELQVLPRPAGSDFAVSAGGYRFLVVGTVFTVSQSESRLELFVREGKVAVWQGSERLAAVQAGGQWAVTLRPAAPSRAPAVHAPAQAASAVRAMSVPIEPVRPPEPALDPPISPTATVAAERASAAPAAPPSLTPPTLARPRTAVATQRDCGQLVAGSPQEAMACYERQATRGGLSGEAALYEIARLWRDSFHDPTRALSAFREQRSRFPHGVLAIEADLSIVELLPRLDRHAEALTESARFLNEHPSAERLGEIHLLRGNIYREGLRDFYHAEREYTQGAEARGRVGDESRFLRAGCLEALGRIEEARAAYESYLSRPNALRGAEAKKRLEHLGR